MQNAYMPKDAAITVRVPHRLKRSLERRARREHRSISAQVLHELERAVEREPEPTARKPAVGRLAGGRVPSDDDFVEIRSMLWGRLGRRGG